VQFKIACSFGIEA